MTTIHGGTEERQVGFAASERARFERAWSMCLLYSANARGQKTLSDILFFCMLMLAMGLICIIVVKHRLFGDLPSSLGGLAAARGRRIRRGPTGAGRITVTTAICVPCRMRRPPHGCGDTLALRRKAFFLRRRL